MGAILLTQLRFNTKKSISTILVVTIFTTQVLVLPGSVQQAFAAPVRMGSSPDQNDFWRLRAEKIKTRPPALETRDFSSKSLTSTIQDQPADIGPFPSLSPLLHTIAPNVRV